MVPQECVRTYLVVPIVHRSMHRQMAVGWPGSIGRIYIRLLDGCCGVASAFLRMMMLGFRRFHPLMAMAYIPDEKVNFLLPYYYLGVRRSSHTEAFQCMQQ